MFRLSKKADYAIVALSHLHATSKPTSAKAIAASYDLSSQMLANVLKALAGAGILESKRGVAGGYVLGKDPKAITIGEVIDVIDGPSTFSDCTDISKNCRAAQLCPAKKPVVMIHKKIKTFVDNISLLDIVNDDAFPELSFHSLS